MSDHPQIAAAKEAIRELVPGAVEKLGQLAESEHDGIALGAVKEILDRGGVPAKVDHNLHVDLTIDEEIESMLRSLQRNANRQELKAELEIEDAIVVQDAPEREPEPALVAGVLPGEYRPPPPPEEEDPNASGWWQAKPSAGE